MLTISISTAELVKYFGKLLGEVPAAPTSDAIFNDNACMHVFKSYNHRI